MKHTYILFAVAFAAAMFLFNQFGFAQQRTPPPIQWEKTYGGSNADNAYSIWQTRDGGYIVAGASYSQDGDITGHHGDTVYSDYWIVKLDNRGNIQWQRSLGGSGSDVAHSIQQTRDGGYIVAGSSNSTNGDVTGNHDVSSGGDYWIVKLDGSGNIQWEKSLGGNREDEAESIEQTKDGGYIVAGWSYSFSGDVNGTEYHGQEDYWIVKLDGSGNIQWRRSLGGSREDLAYSIQQTRDGGYIVAGTTGSNDGDVTGLHGTLSDDWIVKLDGSGNIQWEKSLGGSSDERAFCIQQTNDDGYIVSGDAFSNDGDVTGNHGYDDYWVVKLDSLGDIQWEKSLGGSGSDDNAFSIQQTFDGGYIVVGSSNSIDGDVTGHHSGIDSLTNVGFKNIDYWIVKLSDSGDIQWQKSLGGSKDDLPWCVRQTSDSGYVIAGYTTSNDGDVTGFHGGYSDCWIVKLGPDTAHASIQATDPIDLGSVHVDSSKTVSFTIRNTSGTQNAVITQMTLQGAFAGQYHLSAPSMPDGIAPGDSQTISITFSPKQAGTLDATLHIVANISPSALDIPVRGIGTRSLLAANPVNFDTVSLNDCKTLDFLIRNEGNYPLTIGEIVILGIYASEYTIENNVTDTLHPGDSATIGLQYCPTTPGAEDAVVEIVTNDGDTLLVNIYGAGKNTSSVSNKGITPFATSLAQNYPNPFLGTTAIHVTLSQADANNAQLLVYNMLGEQIADLTDQLSADGDVTLNAGANKAGVYYYVLQTTNGRMARQMFVVK